MKTETLVIIVALVAAPLFAFAKGSCPPVVRDAVEKAHAGAKIGACKREKVDGKTQYDVTLKTSEGKQLVLDASPEGAILLTEEKIAPADVPPAVAAAFAARYPKAKPAAAEKQTAADGKLTYELAFKAGGKKKEATFDASGAFVGEE